MLLSIITVNHNNLEGLKKTLDSVLEQTYSPIEYIVIDGGSTDGSKAYLEAQQKRIDYWVSEPDTGIYHAMNKGVKIAKGDYVLFLNSGDTFYSQESLSHFEPLLKDGYDLIFGNLEVVAHNTWIKTYPETVTLTYFVKDTLPHPATLIKRTCFNNNMYDETLEIASDWKFFMLGICKRKFRYRYINQVIATFYHDGISSTSPELVKQEREQVLRDEFYWSLKMDKLWKNVRSKLKKSNF